MNISMTNKLNFRNLCDTLTCHNTHNGNDYSRVYKAGVIGNYTSLNHSEVFFVQHDTHVPPTTFT